MVDLSSQEPGREVWRSTKAASPADACSVVSDPDEPCAQAADVTIPQLVAEVYESAPADERGHLLEQLLRPLGVLSLVAVADGIFAKIRFRSGWQDLHVRPEDLQSVRATDVAALVDHAQQVSVEAVDGLAQVLASSPVMTGSAAAAVLVLVLLQRARARQAQRDPPGRSAGDDGR
jgi:hypothetical protein